MQTDGILLGSWPMASPVAPPDSGMRTWQKSEHYLQNFEQSSPTLRLYIGTRIPEHCHGAGKYARTQRAHCTPAMSWLSGQVPSRLALADSVSEA
jgi:hypothetical protein